MQINHKKETEDLKRFDKNKKQKEIIIGSIIAIILIIGGISLIASFAMYEEKASFDVLKGTVPDFSTKDITLAFTIDGKTETNKTFPNKDSGYIVEKVDCEDNVTADWNNGSWSLENIKTDGNAKKVKCTVAFKTINTTSGLNGAEPVLGDGMIPVIIKDNGKVYKTTEDNQEWYDYSQKQWANAVILTSDKTDNYKVGNEIPETDIESYFVWIPKFSYQLFDENMGKYFGTTQLETTKQNKAINIKFGIINTEDGEGECKTPMLDNGIQGASGESGHCKVGDYMTHPAFLAFDTTGFWMAKFETSSNSGNIQIKPNVASWTNVSTEEAFQKIKNYKDKLQSHLIKNTEWGAVAYLTQSMYGRCSGENDCTEVSSNNSYTTGHTGSATYGTQDSNQLASTTGNYSGVYDMNGGACEYTATVIWQSNLSLSGLSTENLQDKRYYDIYNYGTDSAHWERRILGDATGELGPFISSSSYYISSMYGDVSMFVSSSYPWFYRGGCDNGRERDGIFYFSYNTGGSFSDDSFRIVLAVK